MAEDVIRVLFPGVKVQIPEVKGCTATVYPVGLRHLKEFSREVALLLDAVSRVELDVGMSTKDAAGRIIGKLAPFLMRDCLSLVEGCVVIDPPTVKLQDLPHWHLPPILAAWVNESFGEEKKWRPWLEALDRVSQRLTGKSIGTLATLFKLSSAAGTGSGTSPTSGTLPSPIGDGASPSSTSGQSVQPGGSQAELQTISEVLVRP